MKCKKMYFQLVLIGTLSTFLFSSCKQEETKKDFIRPVKLVEAASLDVIEKSFPAVVSSDEFSNLAFKVSGPLVAMNVEEGQRVKKGTVVAEIDKTDYLLDLEAKKASFQNALSQKNRAEKLLEKNAISIQEYETCQTTYKNAKSVYESAVNTLDDTKLRAPFDGFIQKKHVENYQRVQPGQEIVRLINPDKLQVQFTIPETNIQYFSNNSSLYVEFDTYKGKLFKTKLKEYVEASPDGSGVPVFLYIDDPEFDLNKYKVSVGFSCRVVVKIETESKISGVGVPLSAIIYDNKSNSKTVFVFEDATQTVRRCAVKDKGIIVGRDEVIVDGNLKKGDRIVAAGAGMLVDGQKVKVLAD